MLVYVIVIAVAVLGLIVGYRAFGGGQTSTADPTSLLLTAHRSLRRSLDSLEEVADGDRATVDAPDEITRSGRRALSAAQHCIDLLPGDADLDQEQQNARVLLTHAIEDLGWAWRMMATPAWQENGGVHVAVTSLGASAARSGAAAAALLSAPAAEPVEGPQ